MKSKLLFKSLFLTGFFFMLIGMTNAQSFTYDIALKSFTIPGLDGVHSYAAGESGGKWLIISGRVDGMHRGGGGPNNPAFPSSNSNKTIYVADPEAMQSWSTDFTGLSTSLQDQMSSTNTNFYQDGDYLYIAGGYGQDNAGNHVTYGYLTAINVPNLIDHIINGTSITGDFIQISDSRMQLAGGQLGKIGDYFYLVGGMELQQRYTQMVNPAYSSEIRKFKILNDGTNISITDYTATSDPEFHRRDYNLISQIYPDGSYGYMVSSGVFTPSDGVFYNPIEIKSTGYTVIPEATFKQEFSHYQSAKLAMYDPDNNEMHSIFFGGIAQYYYDANGNKIDDADVPFVKTISRVTRNSSGVYSESVFSKEMPVYVGAGAELFLDETLPVSGHGIIDMSQLTGDSITVGYIFGGLEAGAADVFPMNTSNSVAANTIYEVILVNNSLPIELLNFSGKINNYKSCDDARVTLSWTTLIEINSESFEIERGKYGNFNRVATIKAAGNSKQKQNYTFTDKAPLRGNAYYRLKMFDKDGSFKYSNVINIFGCSNKSLEISPNPTLGNLFIAGEVSGLEFQIFNGKGKYFKPIYQKVNGGIYMDLRTYPMGVYFIKTNKGETYKILKQ